ncbi:MAG: NAD-dependent epimerase/dehydratase family protein, partial [Vulcanimicrobiaceae bacterium]
MRYLVTGGAGFIGSNIVDELLRRGHAVIVLDDLSTGKERNISHVAGKIDFRKGTITDLDTVRSCCEGVDYVI